MSECKYFVHMGRVCNIKKTKCSDSTCRKNPLYYKEKAMMDAYYAQKSAGMRVRAYKNLEASLDSSRCIHGRLVKAFVKGNSVAYKVRDEFDNNIVTCSFIEIKMFQN